MNKRRQIWLLFIIHGIAATVGVGMLGAAMVTGTQASPGVALLLIVSAVSGVLAIRSITNGGLSR